MKFNRKAFRRGVDEASTLRPLWRFLLVVASPFLAALWIVVLNVAFFGMLAAVLLGIAWLVT